MLFKLLIIILPTLLCYSQAAWNVTCDFDLKGISDIIQYLPTECQLIYKKGRNSTLYKDSLRESRKFAEFQRKLVNYERLTTSTSSNEIPKQNTKFRFHIYNETMLNTCAVDIGNRSDLRTDGWKTKEYYNCLYGKHEEMIRLIESANSLNKS